MEDRIRGAKGSGIMQQWLLPVLIIGGFYGLLFLLGIPCPLRFFTGISCPGCGMTRAWLSILRGSIQGAFAFHPLFWTVPPGVIVCLLRRRIPRKFLTVLMLLTGALYVGVYVLRMLDPSDAVVVFQPQNGLAGRMFRAMIRLITIS